MSSARDQGLTMTYFNYRQIRRTRSEAVYAGPTILGRVAVTMDWRSRLAAGAQGMDLRYRAIGLDGEALPGLFVSRHDAAEALYRVAYEARGANQGAGIHEA